MSLCAVCVCCCWPVFKQERFHFRFQTFYVQFWESEERKLVRVIHWYVTPRETNKYIRMGNFPSTKRSPGLDGDTVWCPAIADGIIMGSKRKDKKHRRGKKKSLQWDIVTRVPLYYRYIEMSEKRILFSSKPRVLFVAVVTVRNHAAGLSVDPADATTVTEEYKSIYIYCICLYVGRRRRRKKNVCWDSKGVFRWVTIRLERSGFHQREAWSSTPGCLFLFFSSCLDIHHISLLYLPSSLSTVRGANNNKKFCE